MAKFLINKYGDSSTITISLKNRPHQVSNSDPKFQALVDAVKGDASDEEIEAILTAEARKLEEAVSVADGFDYNAGILSYQGVALEPVLGDYIINLVRDGFDATGMVNFVRNLFDNPSYRAVHELYPFLKKGNNVITEDGHFLAYKRISGTYYDVHSGEVLNKPAALLTDEERAALPLKAGGVITTLIDGVTTVFMPRNMVDEDSSRTCSAGLHVCSFDYLSSFGGNRVIVCKVNPRDVVSIPQDYNDTKMRVCRYGIVAELEDMARDVLGRGTLVPDESNPGANVFSVQLYLGGGYWEEQDSFTVIDDATSKFRNFVADGQSVRIVNKSTGAVLQESEGDEHSDEEDEEDDESEFVIEEIRADGSCFELESDVSSAEIETALAGHVSDVVVSGRIGQVKIVQAVRKVHDNTVEVLRKISFGD